MQVTHWEVLLSVGAGKTGVLAAEALPSLPILWLRMGVHIRIAAAVRRRTLGGSRTLDVETSSVYIGAPSLCYDSWEGC